MPADFKSIPTDPGILFSKNTVELHSGPYGIVVNNEILESNIYGSLHAKELESLRKSFFIETIVTSY